MTTPGCGRTETPALGDSFIATTLSAVPQQSHGQFSSAEEASQFFLKQVVAHNVDEAMLLLPIVQTYESVDFDDFVEDTNTWTPLHSQTPASPHANLMMALRPVHDFERLCAGLRLMNHRDNYTIDKTIYFRRDEDREGAIKEFKSALSGSIPNEFELAIEENNIVVDKKTTEALSSELSAKLVALEVTQIQAMLLLSPEDQAELLRLIAIEIDSKWYIYQWQVLK